MKRKILGKLFCIEAVFMADAGISAENSAITHLTAAMIQRNNMEKLQKGDQSLLQ